MQGLHADLFGKPTKDSDSYDGQKASAQQPWPVIEKGGLLVLYKPAGWHCSKLVSPRSGDRDISKTIRSSRLHEVIAESSKKKGASLLEWLALTYGVEARCGTVPSASDFCGLCHRLDIQTSGPMLVGITYAAYHHGQRQMQSNQTVREYVALLWGSLADTHGDRGECKAPIDVSSYDEFGQVRISYDGVESLTIWEVVGQYERPGGGLLTLAKFRLVTGRTHQIRVHMAHMGHPIVSDTLYGYKHDWTMCPRIFLHKFKFSFDDMQNQMETVTCSLQMEPVLWNALQRLNLVGGNALRCDDAPGLRPWTSLRRSYSSCRDWQQETKVGDSGWSAYAWNEDSCVEVSGDSQPSSSYVDYNKPWLQMKNGWRYCLLCNTYASDAHLTSDRHGKNTKKPWLEMRDTWLYCLLCNAYATDEHLASEKHIKQARYAEWQNSEAEASSSLQVCDKPWLEMREDWLYCRLCKTYATDEHLASEKHSKRANYAEWHNAEAQQQVYDKPWIEMRDGWRYCLLCNAYASDAHLDSKRHLQQAAFKEWKGI